MINIKRIIKMKKYVIESKGFTQGIGSVKYAEERRKQKEELKKQIAELEKSEENECR